MSGTETPENPNSVMNERAQPETAWVIGGRNKPRHGSRPLEMAMNEGKKKKKKRKRREEDEESAYFLA